MVEAIAVQSGAISRNLSDSLATDRAGSPNPGGLLFDLMALSSTIAVAAAGKATPPRAVSDVTATDTPHGPTEPAIPLSANAFPELAPPAKIDAIPVSVEALIAMDKAAKQGLESKSFVPKPETQWSISILSSGATAPLDQSKLAIGQPILTPDSALKSSTAMGPENLSAINLAVIPQTGSPTVNAANLKTVETPASALLPEQATAPDQPAHPVPTPIARSIMPDPLVAANVEHPKGTANGAPSLDGTMPLVNSLTTTTNLNGTVQINSDVAPPSPSQGLLSATADNAAHLLGTTSNPTAKTQVASDVGMVAPASATLMTGALVPNGQSSKSLPRATASAQSPTLEVQAQDAMPSPIDIAPLPIAGRIVVNSAIPTPRTANADAAVISSKPIGLAEQNIPQATSKSVYVSANSAQVSLDAKPTPTAPFSPRPSTGRKDAVTKSDHPRTDLNTSTNANADAVNPSTLPVLAPMVDPAVVALSSNSAATSSEITPKDEAFAVSADANRKPLAQRGDANSPVFPQPAAPKPAMQAPNSDSISQPATAPSETTRPADTRPAPQDSNLQTDHLHEGPSVALESDHGSHPEQGQSRHPQQQDAGTSKGLFERNSDSVGSNSGQTILSQNSITTIENLPSIASVNTDALPANVTVEAISIHSDSKSQETASASAPSEASPTPSPLTLLDNTDNSSGVIVDSSSFHSHASTSATGASPANGAAAQANAVRTDNPNFIAQRDRAMEQQIIAAIRAGHNEIRLSLYPAQLGQVTINMALDGQKVRVGMKTTNREATNVLLGDRQSLVTSLGHEGFTLDSFDVSDDQPRQQAPNDQTAPQSQAAVHQSTDSSFSLDITI